MANNSPVTPYHVLQSSFATGEISREVANRVDLEKYQFALTKAENVLIRPYGPVYKRPGSKYIAATKSAGTKSKLVSFAGPNNIDYLLEFSAGYVRIYKEGVYKAEVATTFTEAMLPNLRFTQSADVMFIASGSQPLKTLTRSSDTSWSFGEYSIVKPYFDDSLGGGTENCTITPSAAGGNITLTSSENIFFSGLVGGYVRLKQDVASQTISVNFDWWKNETHSYTSGGVYVGENWKIVTHNTWAGKVKVEYSDDNANWKEYRSYSSNSDFNATESGSLTEGKYLRFVITLTDGYISVDLTRLPYTEEGYARVTGYTDAKHVSATVIKRLGGTNATKQWSFSAWCGGYGYPKTVAFFQDRLCLGGSTKQPYMLWMSKTGDYNNFSVEKADGKVTDDSAVALSFVSRKQFDIKHLVPNTDLMVLTQGNEWILSGNEVITPSSATPKMQTTRGCGNVEPIMIGSKTVFVQGRGSIVRDMGYSYETDSYGGADLTLLDKQIVEGKDIIDGTYAQEPNSAIYYVRNDGVIAVLAYVIDQKVYAWSTLKTNGQYESVCAVAEGDTDTIYTVVKRGNKRYIEAFQGEVHTNVPNDYIVLDSAKVVESATKSGSFVAEHLAGYKVTVLGDGRLFENITVGANGEVVLPTTVNRAVIGLPYTMEIELPNIEMKIGDGTMQGRYKIVSEVILRLFNTLGGLVGPDTNVLDRISYDEYQAVENITLYSGDKKIQVPVGGFNVDGRITVKSNDAYPFNLLAMVREVSFGG